MVLSLIGGIVGALGANSAAKKQEATAGEQLALARETRDMTRSDLAPFASAGEPAVNALLYEMGLGDQPEGYQGFTGTPGYDFRMQEGQRALETSAAGRGDLFSGNTGRALTEYGQNIAAAEHGNHVNRLFGLMGNAQSAAAGQGAANTAFGQMGATALANRGDAQAAGITGMTNAITGGINNYIGHKQYNDLMQNYGGGGR